MLTRTILKLTVATALGALLAANAMADGRGGGAQAHRRDGSRHTETQRTENGYTRNSTWTGENGRTATRDANVVNDREAGTRTREVTRTGPDGKTRTVNDVTTRTDDGHVRSTTYTDAEGRTATRDAVVKRDAESGTSTRDVNYVGRDGKERTVNEVTQRTENGHTRDSTFTNAQGETATRSVTVDCDKAAGNCTRDVVVDHDQP